jgi:TetR/AcrR family transcriptional repressor of bet genes
MKMQAVKTQKDKRKVRGDESRRQILHATIACVGTLGLSNTTLDRVAERAGSSRGLVVFHFKSKSNLLQEVLTFLGTQYSEGWNAAYHQKETSNIIKLLRLVDFDIQFAYDNPQYISAWHAFWGEAKGNLLYHNFSLPRDANYGDQLENLISLLIEEGQYDPAELDGINLSLGSMLFGIWVESHLDHNPDDCQRYMKAVRLLLSKFLPRHTIDG